MADGCEALAQMIEGRIAKPQPQSAQELRDRAKEIYRASCGNGDLEACTSLALLLQKLGAAAADVEGLLDSSCAAGVPRGCYYKGFRALGEGRSKSRRRKAIVYFEKACDLGELQGCVYAGGAFEDGKDVAADAPKALLLFEKGCEGGVARACLGASRLLRRVGPQRDIKKAERLLEEVCSSGEVAGCSELEIYRSR
jgi:hypothetical protein